MPLFSAFTPFGQLAFSSKPSDAQAIYDSIVANLGGQYDLTVGGHEEAKVYALARSAARARGAIKRARNSRNPLKCLEMLPVLEYKYGITPAETDGILARQNAIAARMILPRGARQEALEAGLRAILGANFLKLRNTGAQAVANMPTSNFARPEQPFKAVVLTDPAVPGFAVRYTNLDQTAPPLTIAVGDTLTVQPDNTGLREVVTVSSVAPGQFTAPFTKVHDPCVATTQNYPLWTSTQRMLYIVVVAASSIDAETRRKVDDFMSRAARGVTQWQIVQPTTPGATTMGPFTLNTSPVGATTLASITI